MRISVLLSIWLLLIPLSSSLQDDILHLSVDDFDSADRINIYQSDHWQFTETNQVEWADNDIKAPEWLQKGPTNFTPTFGVNKKIEGWFKLKFELDKTFDSIPLRINVSNFGQALEVYIDGKLIHTIGNLGENGETYLRGTPKNLHDIIPLQLGSDTAHILALHYKYEPVKFPASLFINRESLYFSCFLVGPDFEEDNAEFDIWDFSLGIFSTTVIIVIMALIFMLLLQNFKDWFLRLLFVLMAGFLLVALFGNLTNHGIYTTFESFAIYNGLSDFGFTIILPVIPLIFIKVFTGELPRKAWLTIPFWMLCVLEFRIIRFFPLGIFLIFTTLGICAYYISRSRKNLKGAQWYVVGGGMVFLISAVMAFFYMLFMTSMIPNFVFRVLLLAFPISLLGYVVSRFKEVENEVRVNADKVVQITEEKRQQALNQKDELEKEVKVRTAELSESLENLKSTQAQLIQSEKMASLGELTAGIAHEIQNPLNFVNNFSDVSAEMIDEAFDELDNQDVDEAKVVLKELKGNLEKISHHGERASSIVKGMLDHSRESTGEKILTDINALCDEFIKLSYQGLKAKDKSFNAEFELELDENLSKIKVVSQDIGRVLLNVFNNAFYAVQKKNISSSKDQSNLYNPQVKVSTKSVLDTVQISIQDNGMGMNQETLDKVFQPFFTTKPTGEGTGLGLSLSYDIIKAHGGSITVSSTENEGTDLIIELKKG